MLSCETPRALSRALLLGLLCSSCAGCASYLSKPRDGGAVEGVVYYMPKQPLAVQVKVDPKDKTLQTASVVVADIIPDLRRRFVLSYDDILVSENATKIGVSQTGLLTSAGSTVTSGVDTVVKNIATLAGNVSVMAATAAAPATDASASNVQTSSPPPPKCNLGQTYTLLIWPESTAPGASYQLCNFKITFHKTLLENAAFPDNKRAHAGEPSSSGIFYKTELPYLLDISDSNQTSQALAYSPDESGINFVPIERTFFAKNTTQVTLANGLLTEFDQDDTGEVVGASQIPADVISAYFSAVGSAFTNFENVQSDKNAAALSEAKRQLCATTIAANPILSTATPAQQAAAYANIQSACSS